MAPDMPDMPDMNDDRNKGIPSLRREDSPGVETCNGCAVCLSACPGLAIFVVDAVGEGATGSLSLPYEYRPLPERDELVDAVDREGEIICEARVMRVLDSKALDRTPIITIEIPRDHVMTVRHFRRRS